MTNKAAGTVPIVAAAAICEVSRRKHESQKDVLRQFLASKTYASLLDYETGLFADGHYVIADRFLDESNGPS